MPTLKGVAAPPLRPLNPRGEDALGRPEVLEQGTTAHGPDAFERVEDRLPRAGIAPLAMEADRKAVRLVTDPPEQPKAGRVRVEQHRVRPARNEHLFDPLRE